ncbi:MAG: chromate resistance protein ChrB domain-containing protein [Candidatus Nealsonbacteria bacterium]
MLQTEEKAKNVEILVNRLLKAMEEASPKIKKIVGHIWPDLDVLLCFWIAKKFIPKTKDAEIVLLNAGSCIPDAENDPGILHFDTGGGKYDQHMKGGNTCSAVLLAKDLGIENDPGLKLLLDLATLVDNIEENEKISSTDICHVIQGFPYLFRKEGKPDWERVVERSFEIFESLYKKTINDLRNEQNAEKYTKWRILENGIKIAVMFGNPGFRYAAFKKGTTVVLWTKEDGNHFKTGIQTNIKVPQLKLDEVVGALRFKDSKIRGIDTEDKDLLLTGEHIFWFLHDKERLILNGSKKRDLKEDEFTKLKPWEIENLVCSVLSRIPVEEVRNWKQ